MRLVKVFILTPKSIRCCPLTFALNPKYLDKGSVRSQGLKKAWEARDHQMWWFT